jgi:hypothetical protein
MIVIFFLVVGIFVILVDEIPNTGGGLWAQFSFHFLFAEGGEFCNIFGRIHDCKNVIFCHSWNGSQNILFVVSMKCFHGNGWYLWDI